LLYTNVDARRFSV